MLYAAQGFGERCKMSAWELVKRFFEVKFVQDNWLVNNDGPPKVIYEKPINSDAANEFECCGCGGCYQDRGDDK